MNKMQSSKQEWLGHYLNCRPGRHLEQRQCMLLVRSVRHKALARAATGASRQCEWRLSLSLGKLATKARTVFPDNDFYGRKQAS